jgi:transposase
MSGVSKAISDQLYAKVVQDLRVCSRQGDVSRKLQAIKSAKENDISLVAKIFGISRVALMEWISSYKSKGIEGLKIQAGRGRKPVINAREEEIIKRWLEENNRITIKSLMLKIKQELGKKLGKTATYDLMKKLKFSYITPRPRHYKQDKQKQEEFKKKSAEKIIIKTK